MPILDSLLTAIRRADGDALVLHVGERPYVVTEMGNVDLSKTVLTFDAVSGMLAQLVPADLLSMLAEVGAVEHQLQLPSAMRDSFTVVAARGGDDIWIEIRRKRAVVRPVPVLVLPLAKPEVAMAAAPEVGRGAEASEASELSGVPEVSVVARVSDVPAAHEVAPMPEGRAPNVNAAAPEPAVSGPGPIAAEPIPPATPERVPEPEPPIIQEVAAVRQLAEVSTPLPPVLEQPAAEPIGKPAAPEAVAERTPPEALAAAAEPEPIVPAPAPTAPEPIVLVAAPTASEPIGPVAAPTAPEPIEPPRPVEVANVVPLTRVRVEVTPRSVPAKEHSVERLLAAAAARSAELIYLTSQSRPFFRVAGEMRPVENEPIFAAADIDAIVLDLMPESARESHGRGEPAEWTSEFEGVGRVRFATFRDHRGPGVVLQLTATRPISAEQLGLTRDIQALATEPEGLVVVAGPRGGGKSTLIGAMVDLINRQHSVSVITIERQIRIVHDNRLALVSQREVRGTGVEAIAVVRGALRENPDVLVLEDLRSPEITQLALEAAGTGRLVILTITTGSTVAALSRIIEAFPPPSRKAAQLALAERFRGAVSQVVLRKTGGGRIAARELLPSSAEVANLIAEGHMTQLAAALDSGRKHGIVSLNEVLLTLVKNGSVDASEAYRKADNRAALLTLLEHDGVDTSLLARLA